MFRQLTNQFKKLKAMPQDKVVDVYLKSAFLGGMIGSTYMICEAPNESIMSGLIGFPIGVSIVLFSPIIIPSYIMGKGINKLQSYNNNKLKEL